MLRTIRDLNNVIYVSGTIQEKEWKYIRVLTNSIQINRYQFIYCCQTFNTTNSLTNNYKIYISLLPNCNITYILHVWCLNQWIGWLYLVSSWWHESHYIIAGWDHVNRWVDPKVKIITNCQWGRRGQCCLRTGLMQWRMLCPLSSFWLVSLTYR